MNPFQEIASIISSVATDEGDCKTAIDGLFFSRRNGMSQPFCTVQWPCFALVAQGGKSLTLGQEDYHYAVGDYLVVSLDLPVVSRTIKASPELPHLGLGMAINRDRLDALLERIVVPSPALASDGLRGVAVEKAPAELLDAVIRYLRLLDRPQDIPAMAPLIEEEILYRLLVGRYGSRLIRIATADSPSNRIARAIGWLRDNFDRPLRIEDLASHVGMSVSSLHHHFKAITAMTPMQYQKQVRLNEARRLMLVENLDVGTAAHRAGYQSLSQFGFEYIRFFGQSPLRDIAGLRASNTAE